MSESLHKVPRALTDAYDKLRQILRQNRVKGVPDIPPEFLTGNHVHEGIMPIAVLLESQLASYPHAFDAIRHPDHVCFAVERFLDRLFDRADWKAEFMRRAEYVATQCGQGTAYHQAKSEAIAGIRVSWSQPQARQRLKRWRKHDPPVTVGDLWDEEMLTNRLLDGDQSVGVIDAKDRKVAETWHKECKRISREANRIYAHGCWKMHHIYLASAPEPPDPPECLRELLEARPFHHTVQDHGLLEFIELAASALMDWAVEHVALGSDGVSPEPKWDKATEARNKWLYEQCCKVVPYNTIKLQLKNKPKSWGRLGINGIKKAANAYAARHDRPEIPKRQSGAPRKRNRL